ncbi:MAG: glycosyltransferase family 4 protein [Actinomycetota bacterium]|nr:glycosyltransferase family 4 protein [Actinomycetota bacterium]
MSAPLLVHVTTADISLELLLGPQLEAFIEAGYDVVGVSAPGPFVKRVEARGVRHVPLRNATRAMAPHKDLFAIEELRRLFCRLRPTIVHTHNPKPGLYGRLAAQAAGVPVVVNTVHGLYAMPEDDWKKRAVVYSLERLASTCSDAELVQNPEDVVTLREVLREPVSKLVPLGNGIDLDRFAAPVADDTVRATVRLELGVDESTVVVGAVGRLVLEKGYVELFEAWERIRPSHPDAVLVVVGPTDADKADALPADVVARAEAAGVRFLGMRDDVHDLYRGMDLYVLASHREGFPRSAMEAAACGLPIIATDIRGCRQVVDHDVTGLLVEPRSPAALADALERLLGERSTRAAMGAAAVARAHREFDQRRVIDTTLETYARLLTARGLDAPEPVGTEDET